MKIEELQNVNQVEFEQYVPVVIQKAMADALVRMLIKEDEYGFKNYDSTDADVVINVAYVSLFSDVELTEDDFVNYDRLAMAGVIDSISYHDAFIKFESMVYARLQDVMRENSIDYAVYRMSHKLFGSVDNMFEHLNGMLDKGDPNKIAKYLSKASEMLVAKMPDFSKADALENLKKVK